MIFLAEFGRHALVLAGLLTLTGSLLSFNKLAGGIKDSIALQRRCVLAAGIFLFASLISMLVLLLNSEFAVLFVHQHSHTSLAWYYKISSLWGGHEGSMLLWLGVMSCIIFVFILTECHKLSEPHQRKVLGWFAFQMFLFTVFTLITSDPFKLILPEPPGQGTDLNPLLQDWAMAIHPPLLYFGYLTTLVPFSLALTRYAGTSLHPIIFTPLLLAMIKRWLAFSATLLAVGIGLGSWWAYRELGWGGWWFWDPVENLSLLPWIAVIMGLHTVWSVSKKKQGHTALVVMCLMSYPSAVLGAFVIRSGLLVSVHNFTNDSERGLFLFGIFAILAVFATASFFLSTLRLASAQSSTASSSDPKDPQDASGKMPWELTSHLAIFAAIAAVVVLGTFFPIIAELVTGKAYLVGAPFFNEVMTPIGLVLLALMLMAALYQFPAMRKYLSNPWTIAAVVLWMVVCFFTPMQYSIYPLLLGLTAGLIIFAVCLWTPKQQLKNKLTGKFASISAHLGMVLLALGSVIDHNHSQVHEVVIYPNQPIHLSSTVLKLSNQRNVGGSTYQGTQVDIQVWNQVDTNPALLGVLSPERRFYHVSKQFINEAEIYSSMSGHIHVVLGKSVEFQGQQGWVLRINEKPLIQLVFLGFALMALGTFSSVILRARSKVVS